MQQELEQSRQEIKNIKRRLDKIDEQIAQIIEEKQQLKEMGKTLSKRMKTLETKPEITNSNPKEGEAQEPRREIDTICIHQEKINRETTSHLMVINIKINHHLTRCIIDPELETDLIAAFLGYKITREEIKRLHPREWKNID